MKNKFTYWFKREEVFQVIDHILQKAKKENLNYDNLKELLKEELDNYYFSEKDLKEMLD